MTSPLEIQRSLAATEHWQPEEATKDKVLSASRFDFLIYLPHCIAGLAILSSQRLRKVGRCRRFVVDAVDLVAQGTTQHGHFVAAGRSLVSPVEHLWLYRLLRGFEETTMYESSVAVLQDRIVERRWGPTVALAAVAGSVALIVSAAVTRGTVQLALSALAAALVTLGMTVIAANSKRLT